MTLLPFIIALNSPVSEAASYSLEMSISALASRSDHVIVGEVLSTRPELNDAGIFTVATMRVHETMRGESELIVEARVPGGSWGNVKLHVSGSPDFIVGEEMLLFMNDGRIVGMDQGAMLVGGDHAWRPGRLGGFAAPSNWRESLEEMARNDPSAEVWHLDEVRIAVQ
jgi:hypothetical protein